MRAIHEIADEISRDWKRPYFGAVPYLDAMRYLAGPGDKYGFDDARSIVTYFLCNAATWRGDVAKRCKAELKRIFNIK